MTIQDFITTWSFHTNISVLNWCHVYQRKWIFWWMQGFQKLFADQHEVLNKWKRVNKWEFWICSNYSLNSRIACSIDLKAAPRKFKFTDVAVAYDIQRLVIIDYKQKGRRIIRDHQKHRWFKPSRTGEWSTPWSLIQMSPKRNLPSKQGS